MTLQQAINEWAESVEQTAKKAKKVATVLTKVAEQTKGIPANQALDVETKADAETDRHAEVKSKDEPAVTIEMIRSVLAEKSQNGMTSKVKTTLNSFGADKLSAVKPEDYEALYAAAKEIG